MKTGQRFFQVKVEGRELSFYGGLAEIAKLYDLNYQKISREIRDGKTLLTENGVEIKAVQFRVKK